jgi:hypothetical protein
MGDVTEMDRRVFLSFAIFSSVRKKSAVKVEKDT